MEIPTPSCATPYSRKGVIRRETRKRVSLKVSFSATPSSRDGWSGNHLELAECQVGIVALTREQEWASGSREGM